MLMATIMIASSLAGAYMEERKDSFPTDATVCGHMNALQKDFRLADPNEDNWLGFLPLLEAVVRHQGEVGPEVRDRIEHAVIGNFTMYVFAGASEDNMVKADFSGRLASMELIARFEVVRRDTNALFRVAEHLSGAVGLSCDKDEEVPETIKADELDRRLVFGDNVPPRMYGDLTFVSVVGRHGREARNKFRFRRVYNERLPGFRTAALRCFYSAVKEGFEGATDEERQAIWDEFCRRAKASADERANAEKVDESISMPRAWALAVDGAGRRLENVDKGVDKGTELLRAASKCGKDAMNPNIASCLVSFVDNPAYPDLEEARSLSDSRATTDVSNNNASAEHVGFVRRLEEPSSPEKAKEEQH